MSSYQGDLQTFVLNRDLSHKLRGLAKTEGTTLYVVLLAAFQLLLHRYSGQEQVIVGSPIFGRSESIYSTIIGHFVNMLVLKSTCTDNPTFTDFLSQVRQTVLGAIDHQDLPFPLLVEQLNIKHDIGRSPLFQVTFDMQRAGQSGDLSALFVPGSENVQVDLGGLLLGPYHMAQQLGQFDLGLQVLETEEVIPGTLKYSTDLFHEDTIRRMIGHYEILLEGITTNPQQQVSELTLLTEAERKQILVEWNATEVAYPQDVCVHQLFEQQVARTPDAVAVRFEDQHLTYTQLNQRANQVAHYLRDQGMKPGSFVGVCMERSLEMVISLYAILKAGAAYVPLDPEYPSQRLTYMIEDAKPPLLLTQRHLIDLLDQEHTQVIAVDTMWEVLAKFDTENLEPLATIDDLAYMIYTSGSTGQPKGAMIPNRGIVNRLLWMQDEYHLNQADVVLQKTPFSFDVSVWEFFWPLLTGAQLVVARPGGHRDPVYLVNVVSEYDITTMHFVPSMLELFLDYGDVSSCTSLRRIICSGEALPIELQKRFFERLSCDLHNLYGPTEAAVDVTYWACDPLSQYHTVPIGRPVANTQIYILDRFMQPVPIGITGELYIGGVQVGQGYFGRPELTSEKFIHDPFSHDPNSRLYKTGDLARYLPDGNIEYLGRLDFQVKIRGLRIELGEIEAALERHPKVIQCITVVFQDKTGDKRLVSYVTSRDGNTLSPGDLREYLKADLPAYMLPTSIMILEAFPLTSNGKIDRRALPAPQQNQVPARTVSVPQTSTEALLADVWSHLLDVAEISVFDNFFDLGGHSLQAIRFVAIVEEKMRYRLDPLVVRFQTLKQLAATIDLTTGKTLPETIASQASRAIAVANQEIPLFFGPDNELFGMYYQPQIENTHNLGVVVCPPWGQEYIRAHRACHQLALRLSNIGIPVLRFDYYGSGDSAGDDNDTTIHRSLQDISLAVDELRVRSGRENITLVGLRLGGMLASLAGVSQMNLKCLVLWDPIVNGCDYLSELTAWHQRNLWYYLANIEKQTNHQGVEILGFAVSDVMRDELEEVDLLKLDHKPADQILLIEREPSESTSALRSHLMEQHVDLNYQLVDAPQLWAENPDKALVPQRTLETIIAWITEVIKDI